MTDTYCKMCAFNDTENQCHFNIPTYLDNKEIQQKDGFNLIKDYKCLYGTSKDSISENSPFEKLAEYAVAKNHIRYYLFVDLIDYDIDKILDIVNIINKLDIKPKFVSFFIKIKPKTYEIAHKIQETISEDIKWKLHNFMGNDTVEHARYVNIATNINANNSSCIAFWKPDSSQRDTLLNDRINFVQFFQLVKQDTAHVIAESLDNMDGMFMPFLVYKELIDDESRNIITAIDNVITKKETIKILLYDYDAIKN
jgi:hypothetical protein